MFKWFRNAGRIAESATISHMALNCWKRCFAECAELRGGSCRTSSSFWHDVAHMFVVKWREVHPASKDPRRVLEERCHAYLEWFDDQIQLRIMAGEFSAAEADRIGEFMAVGMVRGIEEAIVSDAERASLIHDFLPRDWLEAAGFVPEKFDAWYLEATGKQRVHRKSELDL